MAYKLVITEHADDVFQHLGRTEMEVLRAFVNKNLPLEQGKAEGKAETALQNIKSLMKTMGWSAEQAMDALEISGSDRETVKSRL